MKSKKPILNLLHSSLVNRQVRVISHSDPTLINISGIIVSESRNIIILQTQTKIMQIAKSGGIFEFNLNNQLVHISGDLLLGEQKRRSKRRIRGW